MSLKILQEVLVSTADEAKAHFVSVIPFTKHGPFQKYAFCICNLRLNQSVRHLLEGTVQALFSLPSKRRMKVNFQCDFQYFAIHIKVQ